jgi:hypothetical protein
MHQDFQVHALVGAGNADELANSIAGGALQLSPSEAAWLNLTEEALARSAQ